MNILHLDSAITGDASVTRKLTAGIVDRLKAANPAAAVTYRDLNLQGVPVIDSAWHDAVYARPEHPTPQQQQLIERSDAYVNEVRDADVLVIGLPVYNFNLPATLKSWLDQIARAGITFRYSEAGPEGLLKGKRAIVAYASGGTPLGSEADHASRYLRYMLGFLGITDVHFVAADRLALDREAALGRADDAVSRIAA